MKKMLVLFGAVFLLFSSELRANPLPYIPIKVFDAVKAYEAILALPADSVAKNEFFFESEKNLNITPQGLADLVQLRLLKVEACKNCLLESAGLKDGKSVYWRTVKSTEKVVYVHINREWNPWFLLPCANPVRVRVVKPESLTIFPEARKVKITPVPESPEIIEQPRLCSCLQEGTIFMVSPTTLHDGGWWWGGNKHQFNWLYKPTQCVTDDDYNRWEE